MIFFFPFKFLNSFFLKKKVKVNTRNISSRDTTPPTKENYLYITLFSLLLSYICLKLSYYIDLKSVLFFYLIFLFIYYLYITIDFLIIIYYIKYCLVGNMKVIVFKIFTTTFMHSWDKIILYRLLIFNILNNRIILFILYKLFIFKI